jgi:hypothetical protein
MIRSIGRSDGAMSLPDVYADSNEERIIARQMEPRHHDKRTPASALGGYVRVNGGAAATAFWSVAKEVVPVRGYWRLY